MKELLKERLKPLYVELLDNARSGDCAFCIQWGKEFPQESNTGLIFVGRAVNSWISDELDIECLFDERNDCRVFNRADQIEWVENLRGNISGYNTNKSAFWRVIKQTTERLYPSDKWYKKIAWSNLCKLSPFDGGNPSNSAYYDQLKINKKILNTEFEVLSPKVIVFLTKYNWVKYYYTELLNQTVLPIKTIIWGGGYKTYLYKIGDYYIIVSEHPMGKNEETHINALVELIKFIS